MSSGLEHYPEGALTVRSPLGGTRSRGHVLQGDAPPVCLRGNDCTLPRELHRHLGGNARAEIPKTYTGNENAGWGHCDL